jgi:hypothetical protein
MAQVVSEEEALRRYVDCAICIGYCQDSNRFHLVDDFHKDIFGLYLLLGPDEPSRLGVLSRLMDHSNPWVRYHAALRMLEAGRMEALDTMEALEKEPKGMFGTLASLAVKLEKNKGQR